MAVNRSPSTPDLRTVLSNCDAKRDHNYRLGADNFTITTAEYQALKDAARVSETPTIERCVQLEKALQQCVNVAKAWHGDDAFDLYFNHSPEMKLIRDALGKMPEEA